VVVALLLAFLAVLATRQVPLWLEAGARAYLAPHGIETLAIGASRWHWNGLVLERISLAGVSEGIRFDLAVQEATIRYGWRDLLNGELALVRVGALSGRVTLPEGPGAGEGRGAVAIAPLLPRNWLPGLPVNRVVLNRVAVDLRHQGTPTLFLQSPGIEVDRSALSLQGELALSTAEPGLGEMTLTADGLPLRLSLSLRDKDSEIASIAVRETGAVAGAERPGSPLRYSAGGDIHLEPFRQWLAALSSHSERAGSIVPDELPPLAGDSGFSLDVSFPASMDMGGAPLAGVTLQGNMRHRLEVPRWPETGLSEFSLSLEHRLSLEGGSLKITPLSPLRIAGLLATPASVASLVTGPLRFSLKLDTDEALTLKDAGATLPAARLEASVAGTSASGSLSADLRGVALDGASASGEWRSRLQGNWRGRNLPALDVDGRFERGESGARFSGTLDQDAFAVTGDWRVELGGEGAPRSATADIALSDLSTLVDRLGRLVSLPFEVGLTEGHGSVSYRLIRSPGAGLRHEAALVLDNMTGLVAGTAVQGATFSMALSGDDQWRSTRPLALEAKRIDMGAAVTDFSLIAELVPSRSLASARVAVEKAAGRLFDGRIALAEPFTYDLSDRANDFAINLENLDLAAILALYPQKGLSGTGTLDGRVPIRVAADGVVIDGGTVQSQPPGGVIRYTLGGAEKGLAASSPQLATTLELLENFRYERLGSTVSLGPQGDLLLEVALSGHNPDVYRGRTVNFNINVEDNLYELLRVLRLTDDLINNLEERLGR
jgi:hypothetical protein